jgi:hypothetical protein
VSKWFEQAQAQGFAGIEYSYYETKEGNHDRIEIRKYWSVPASVLGGKSSQQWAGLCSIVMVVSERRLWNKTTKEVRYYISSLSSDALVLGQVVRSHWGIENSLHWGGVSAGEATRPQNLLCWMSPAVKMLVGFAKTTHRRTFPC